MPKTDQGHFDRRHAIYQLNWESSVTPAQIAQLGFSHIRVPTLYPWKLGPHQRLLAQIAREAPGLRVILTLDPAIMTISNDNPWWNHALTHGKQSPYYNFFQTPFLLPIFNSNFNIYLRFDSHRGFVITHHTHILPVAMRSYPGLLSEWIKHEKSNPYLAPHEIRHLEHIIVNIQKAILQRYADGDSLITKVINWFSASHARSKPLLTFIKTRQDFVTQLLKEQYYRLIHVQPYELHINIQDPDIFHAYHKPIAQLMQNHRIISAVQVKNYDHRFQSLFNGKVLIEEFRSPHYHNINDNLLRRKIPDIRQLDHSMSFQLMSQILNLRRSYPILFEKGRRIKLKIEGISAAQIQAFVRIWKEQYLLVVMPHFDHKTTRLELDDTQIILPKDLPYRWENVLNSFLVLARHQKIRCSTLFSKRVHDETQHPFLFTQPAIFINVVRGHQHLD